MKCITLWSQKFQLPQQLSIVTHFRIKQESNFLSFFLLDRMKNIVNNGCCCSVAQSCLTLSDFTDCSMRGCPVLHYLREFAQLMFVESMMPSNHLILCHSFLLLPSIFPRIRVFSNELALRIKWPKYWSFCFRFSPSNEYSGFRVDFLQN